MKNKVRISHIVAAAKNGVIGRNGELPWHIPEDMRFFRETTKGKCIIMGRKTFEAVGHPLPHRLNVVVTRQKNYVAKGGVVFSTIQEAIEHCKEQTGTYGDEIFIIGGGEIYSQSMNLVDRIYLTRIHRDYVGDAKYPDPDESQFVITKREDRSEPEPFSFLVLDRKK